MSKSTIRTYIKNTADPVYSRYIRVKEADMYGQWVCITCGTRRKWDDEIDAGHFQTRLYWATRFDDRNVHAQCTRCNRTEGEKGSYTRYLDKRYGTEAVDALIRDSHRSHTLTLDGLKQMVKEWRAEIDKMATVKNL